MSRAARRRTGAPNQNEQRLAGAQDGDDTTLTFVPREFMERDLAPLTRPRFLAIIASNVLATTLLKKSNGRVDGFVVEGPSAGGHNAPPRGKPQFNQAGEPVYGERDKVEVENIRDLGLPFWLAGGYGSPEKLREALSAGAAGVQETLVVCSKHELACGRWSQRGNERIVCG